MHELTFEEMVETRGGVSEECEAAAVDSLVAIGIATASIIGMALTAMNPIGLATFTVTYLTGKAGVGWATYRLIQDCSEFQS